nr:MAG TPA: hypothetical protein [Caudoviricetes sp.]
MGFKPKDALASFTVDFPLKMDSSTFSAMLPLWMCGSFSVSGFNNSHLLIVFLPLKCYHSVTGSDQPSK